MPRPRKNPHLPRAAAQLAIILETKPTPIFAELVFDAVRRAIVGNGRGFNPVTTFNRNFGALKRKQPHALAATEQWLRRSSVTQMLAGLGQSGNRRVWITALSRMQRGQRATTAFGVKGGAPKSWSFLKYHRGAAQVERLLRYGVSMTQALLYVESLGHDKRDVQRAHATLKKHCADEETLDGLCA